MKKSGQRKRLERQRKKACIKVSIAYTKKNTIKYPNSLLSDDRYVYKGLPEEYVEEVCNTVSEVINEKDDYLQCNIAFGHADAISTMSIADFTTEYVKDINLRY